MPLRAAEARSSAASEAWTDGEVLAAFYSTLSRGLALQARDGASRERLQEIVDVAMRAWPSAAQQAPLE